MSNHQNSPILHFRKELSVPPVAKSGGSGTVLCSHHAPRDEFPLAEREDYTSPVKLYHCQSATGIAIRTIEVSRDVATWLQLRDRAIAGLTPLPRPWTAADFQAEMLAKPWWRDGRCWIAEACETAHTPQTMIGSVTLAERVGKQSSMAVVHWLIVDPTLRRHGIGHLLMNCLEGAAWEAGHREIQLETHAGWIAAVTFYQSIGYAPERGLSPR